MFRFISSFGTSIAPYLRSKSESLRISSFPSSFRDRSKVLFFAFLFVLIGLPSCGVSPLLNHLSESSIQNSGSGNSEESQRNPHAPQALSADFEFKRLGLSAQLTWKVKQRSGVRFGVYELIFWRTQDSEFKPVLPAPQVQTLLWMPEHGHGSNFNGVVKALATPGHYEVSESRFTMEGTWEMRVLLKNESGQTLDEAVLTTTYSEV